MKNGTFTFSCAELLSALLQWLLSPPSILDNQNAHTGVSQEPILAFPRYAYLGISHRNMS